MNVGVHLYKVACFSLGLVSLVKHGYFYHYSGVHARLPSRTWKKSSKTLSSENTLMNLQNQRHGKVRADLEFQFHLPSPFPAVAYPLLRDDSGNPRDSFSSKLGILIP